MTDLGEDPVVYVRRRPADHMTASCRLSALWSIRWSDVSGGVARRTSRPAIFANVMCDVLEGEIGHSGIHGPCPHEIKVCVPKACNDAAVYLSLKAIADEAEAKRQHLRAK